MTKMIILIVLSLIVAFFEGFATCKLIELRKRIKAHDKTGELMRELKILESVNEGESAAKALEKLGVVEGRMDILVELD